MENQVGSINFDANGFNLEEDSDHEDDKQQDNEIKQLLSQGALGDDDFDSSSGESSYDESDSSENPKSSNMIQQHPPIQNYHHQHHHHIYNNNSNNIDAKMPPPAQPPPLTSSAFSNHIVNANNENNLDHNLIENQIQQQQNENEMHVYSPLNNMNNLNNALQTPAHQNIKPNGLNTNYLKNQYSTPFNNQAPPPQMLQATVIPNVQEDKLFYRQRGMANSKIPESNDPNFINKYQQPNYIDTNDTVQQINENDDDIEPQADHFNKNYVHLNQQNYMERFAVPNTLMPQPQILSPHEQHVHLANDPDLSLNVSDNDEDNSPRDNLIPNKPIQVGLVQLEYTGGSANNNEKIPVPQQQQVGQNRLEEGSMLDLNELDELQMKQIKIEEEKLQNEYFNFDTLNSEYIKLQILYKARGKKLEDVSNNYNAYKEDIERKIRATQHQMRLLEEEAKSKEMKLEQSNQLCLKYKADVDQAKSDLAKFGEEFEKLKSTNHLLEKKLQENEMEIENLHHQLNEQQKSDTLERLRQQHDEFVEQLRQRHESETFMLKKQVGDLKIEIGEKMELINAHKMQFDTAIKNAEISTIERNERINQLTKNLNDLQAKYHQEIVIANANSLPKNEVEMQLNEKNNIIEQLNKRCLELDEQLRLADTINRTNRQNNTSSDFHLSNLTNTLGNGTSNNETLSDELNRALTQLKSKRFELQKFQVENENLKSQLAATAAAATVVANKSQASPEVTSVQVHDGNVVELQEEINRLSLLVEELNKEKNDLNCDINEKNAKLDVLLEREEKYNNDLNQLHHDLANKDQHIADLNNIIDDISTKLNGNAQMIVLKYENELAQNRMTIGNYETELSELRMTLKKYEIEIEKIKNSYLEVCKEKNDLNEKLREELEVENERKLKIKLESILSEKLETQQRFLKDQWLEEKNTLVENNRRMLEASGLDLKTLKDQLKNAEEQFKKIELEKQNLETRSNKIETELKEKCFSLEKLIKENEDRHVNEVSDKETELSMARSELEAFKAKINDENLYLSNQLAKSENNLNELEKKYEAEKLNFIESIENLTKEKEILAIENQKLNDKLENELKKFKETDLVKAKELEVKFKETSDKLVQMQLALNETSQKLSQAQNKLSTEEERFKTELTRIQNEFDQKKSELLVNIKKDYENSLNDEIKKHNELKENYEKSIKQHQTNIDKLNKTIQELNEKMETQKQSWTQEKNNIVAKKEEELQKVIFKLEKRFEEDYSNFINQYKETMQRTLTEKSSEYDKEKEKLIEMYDSKLNEYETKELNLNKQIKELKEKSNKNVIPAIKPKSYNLIDIKTQTDEYFDREEYINGLLTKINSLEDVINNTDAHFELELEKLRQELDEEYQVKLKYELEKQDITCKQYEQEIENLKYQLEQKLSQNSSHTYHSGDNISLNGAENNVESEYDLSTSINKSNVKAKYSKLKNELNLREKEMETVEQAYRFKMDQINEKFEEHLRQMKSKYENDLQRAKIELNDNYKQALSKSRDEIEKMDSLVQKLKKTNTDSNKVIESLKQEMNKMKEGHLNEITTIKLNSERDKETLKDNYDQALKRISSLDKQLISNEEHFKKQTDLLTQELKLKHDNELTRMSTKMKHMMESHALAVENLKKQHQKITNKSSSNAFCQTDASSRDIEALTSFREKSIETLNKMKADMLKEYDAQSQRSNERVLKELNEFKKRIQEAFLPKIVELLREFRISEAIIRMRIGELENELEKITKSNDPKRPASSLSNQLTASTSSLTKSINDEAIAANINQPTNAHLFTQNHNSAKRSVSVITSVRPSPSKNEDNNHASTVLHSKSASNMKEFESTNTETKDTTQKPRYQSMYEQHKPNGSPNGLVSGYKYTPLRQSWSNLSQMHQLSPYSLTNTDNSVNRKTLVEENGNLSSDENNEHVNRQLSPALSSHSTRNPSNANRPNTADSSSFRSSKLISNSTSRINHELLTKLKDSESKFDELNEKEDNEDYIYVDDYDNEQLNEDLNGNAYFKKYRTQNIRIKRTTPKLLQNQLQQRPHSASILSRENLSSNSNSVTSSNLAIKNPIDALYEMSKNYKTIEAGSSNKVIRSKTNIEQSTRRQLTVETDMNNIIKPKTTLSLTTKTKPAHIYDNDSDETPIRLSDISSNSSETNSLASNIKASNNQPIRSTSAITSTNTIKSNLIGVKMSATTVTNQRPASATSITSNTLTFNSNSLPRSRTPNPINDMVSSHSYRSSANSMNKNLQSILNDNTTGTISNVSPSSLSSTSTQYHQISSSVAKNLVKNTELSKKKPAFY